MYDYYITPEEYETAERNGISRVLLDKRVRDLLWDKETAINKPPRKQDYSLSKYADVAEQNGIHRNTFFTRVKSGMPPEKAMMRSEEHTSELQSRLDIVCRLLLENKKLIHARTHRRQGV